MPPRIVNLSVSEGMQARLREVVNFKLAKDEVFGVEEKNQFIQPGDAFCTNFPQYATIAAFK